MSDDDLDLDAPDLAGGAGLSIGAQLSIQLGRQTDAITAALAALSSGHAVPLDLGVGAVAAAGKPTLLNLGGPNRGRFWKITGLVVNGSDDRTVLAGTQVAFYIGNAGMAATPDLVLPGSQGGSPVTVPANAQWGNNQLCVQNPQQAFVLVYGAAAAQQLQAGIFGWDLDVSAFPHR